MLPMIKAAFFCLIFLFSIPTVSYAQFTELVVTLPAFKGGMNKIQLLQNSTDPSVVNRLVKRLEAIRTRQDKINQKLASKIAKVEQKSLDVATFVRQLGEIQTKIDGLKDGVENIRNSSAVLLSSNNPQIDYSTYRVQLITFLGEIAHIKENQKSMITGLREVNKGN